MAAVLQQPEPAASQAGSTSNGGAGPYLNNAERVFDYTIDYEVRASRPLVMGSIADSSTYTPIPQTHAQDEGKLHQGIKDVAREIVGGWKDVADGDLDITVISESTMCWPLRWN